MHCGHDSRRVHRLQRRGVQGQLLHDTGALVLDEHVEAAGQLHAAIDVCYLALATSPADPGLHLNLAELYLDLGWRSTAADKLVLMARLAELDDDRDTRARLCAVVADRLADDPRLVSLCA